MTPVLSALAHMLRTLSSVLKHWPLIVLAALILSPVGPHLRWQYTAIDAPSGLIYLRCHYIGARGLIADVQREIPACPLVAVIDTRRRS